MASLEFFKIEDNSDLELQLFESRIQAGFPSPAQGAFADSVDLNHELINNPAATFCARVIGDSMVDSGINEGDMLIIDRSLEPHDGDIAVCHMPQNGVKSAFVMPRGMQAFLGRTFNYPVVYHYLMPLCEYFKGQNRGNDISRMFLHLNAVSMDMVVYRDGALMCANSYPFANADDAVYFALNAWTTYGLDQLTDELQLAGDGDLRAAMTPALRKFVKFVMPVVYPAAAMRLGRNAMQAPLDLILLALCE